MNRAPGFIAANAAVENMPLVSSVSRAWTLTMSLSARPSSNESSEAPTACAAAGSAKGSWASTRLPKAASSWAMREPTAPSPISPTAVEHSGCRFRRRPAPWSRDTGPEAESGRCRRRHHTRGHLPVRTAEGATRLEPMPSRRNGGAAAQPVTGDGKASVSLMSLQAALAIAAPTRMGPPILL